MRNVNFRQISPRSWWHNIDQASPTTTTSSRPTSTSIPFNGAAFYNSGRANGFGFWGSALFALGGAFYWECCGETHPMSFNDIFSTGLGGIALGEAQYRLSSEILNNQSRGMGRFWSEFGGLPHRPGPRIQPARQRDARSMADNPVDPMDWRPPGGRLRCHRACARSARAPRSRTTRRPTHDPAEPQLRRRLREHAAKALRLHRLRRAAQLRGEGRRSATCRSGATSPRGRSAGRCAEPRLRGGPALRLPEQHRLRVRRAGLARRFVALPALRQLVGLRLGGRLGILLAAVNSDYAWVAVSPIRSASASTTTARASAAAKSTSPWPAIRS